MVKAEAVQYPPFRITVLNIEKARAAQDIAAHNENLGRIITEGNYEIKSSSVSDSPAELQIILVLQQRS